MKCVLRRLSWRLAAFRADSSGATAILAAVLMMVLIVATGVAVDFGSAMSDRTALQSAADSAVLAAAKVSSDDPNEQAAAGKRFFAANYEDHEAISLEVGSDNGVISVTASKNYPTKILGIIGINTVPINVYSEVPSLTDGRAEIVLVLDFSLSMITNNKYVRLKNAATKLIDAISNNGANTNVKFGIVPFSGLVHTELPAGYIRSDVIYNGCTQDRRYPSNTEETAGGSNESRWGEIATPFSCTGMAAFGLKVVPLTSDVSSLKSKLNAMRPNGWTHISLGAAFGWQVLSPTGPYATATDYGDTSTPKIMVLLTDGKQTIAGWGPGQSHTISHGEKNLLAICKGMKDKKISVYTVGYDLTDAYTLGLLKDCASPGKFYDSNGSYSALLASFGSISTDVRETMIRISK